MATDSKMVTDTRMTQEILWGLLVQGYAEIEGYTFVVLPTPGSKSVALFKNQIEIHREPLHGVMSTISHFLFHLKRDQEVSDARP